MAFRSYITAGAAFATVGMVALVPAIAPPLAPRDIQVVKQTEAQVNLAALSLKDLINTYFGVDPQNGVPLTDAPGTSGVAGVIYQLLMQQQGSYVPGQLTLTQYFNGGAAALAQLYLVANNSNEDQQAGINAFFAGISELVRLYLVTNNSDPAQQEGINAFFDGGVSQLVYEYLYNGSDDAVAQAFLDNFYTGGVSQLAFAQLGGDTGTPDEEGEEGDLLPTSTPYLSSFFGINNNIIDPDGSGSPSLTGVSGVVYTRFKAAQATGDLTPEQMSVIDPFFNGGVSEVTRAQILSRLPAGSVQADLVNEFYDNGISGVVRYLLVGPAPEPPPPPPVPPAPAPLMARSFVAQDVSVPDVPDVPDVPSTAKAGGNDVTPVAAKVDPAPAAPAAPAAAPAANPGSAPDNKEAFTAKIREVPKDEEEVTDTTTDGNKVEPIIIEGAGGPKAGEGSWGIFQGVADALGGLGTKPATPSAPSGDAGGGSGEGGGAS